MKKEFGPSPTPLHQKIFFPTVMKPFWLVVKVRDSQEVEREEQERRRRKKEDKERKKELKQEGGGGGTPSKMARLEQQLKQEPADQANNKSTRPSGLQVRYPLQRYIVTPLSLHRCEV